MELIPLIVLAVVILWLTCLSLFVLGLGRAAAKPMPTPPGADQ